MLRASYPGLGIFTLWEASCPGPKFLIPTLSYVKKDRTKVNNKKYSNGQLVLKDKHYFLNFARFSETRSKLLGPQYFSLTPSRKENIRSKQVLLASYVYALENYV